MQRTIHLSANIDGLLRERKGHLKDMFTDNETGQGVSDAEARAYLQECKAKGWRVIPMCECDNFDYQTGCKGHIKSKECEAVK